MTVGGVRRARVFLVLVTALFGCLGAVEAGAEPATIRWQGGLLSIRADRTNRAALLREVARQTNTEITGLPEAAGDITLRFTSVPLDAALKMIADDGGYALVRRDVGGHARYALYLVGNGTPASSRAAAVAPAGVQADSMPPPFRPVMPARAPGARPPIPMDGSVTVTEEGG